VSEEANTVFNFWKDIFQPFAIPALGAIAGLFLKDWIDRNRAKIALGASDAEFLCTQVNEIRELALSYWSNDSTPSEEAIIKARIMGMLHGSAELLASMTQKGSVEQDQLMDALTTFRRACTSGDFGQTSRETSPERFVEIELEGRTLVAKILTFRRR
jgi:hypothetical protein